MEEAIGAGNEAPGPPVLRWELATSTPPPTGAGAKAAPWAGDDERRVFAQETHDSS
jgi:hypothetical protein